MQKPLSMAFAALSVLGACAEPPQQVGTPPPQQVAPARWGYNPGERAPSVISEYEFDQLTEQVTNFKAQRASLIQTVRNSPPSNARDQYVRSIEDLNERIRMLEYRLRAAGRPVPAG